MRTLLIAVLVLGLAACATKRSGRPTPMAESQMQQMTCAQIDAGMAEVVAIERLIAHNSSIDFRSLLGFANDLGIGNRIERRRATEAVRVRRAQLEALWFERGCNVAAE